MINVNLSNKSKLYVIGIVSMGIHDKKESTCSSDTITSFEPTYRHLIWIRSILNGDRICELNDYGLSSFDLKFFIINFVIDLVPFIIGIILIIIYFLKQRKLKIDQLN